MRVQDNELHDFIRDFGRRNVNVTRERLLAVLKARFYEREDPRQLIDRLENLGLTETKNQCITIRFIR